MLIIDVGPLSVHILERSLNFVCLAVAVAAAVAVTPAAKTRIAAAARSVSSRFLCPIAIATLSRFFSTAALSLSVTVDAVGALLYACCNRG